jgi:hypothetical protein
MTIRHVGRSPHCPVIQAEPSALAALTGRADSAAAAVPPEGADVPGIYRYRVGSFEVTALYDGIWYRPITDKFIRNAPLAEVENAPGAGPGFMKELLDASHACDSQWISAPDGAVFFRSKVWKHALHFRNVGH